MVDIKPAGKDFIFEKIRFKSEAHISVDCNRTIKKPNFFPSSKNSEEYSRQIKNM